MLQGNGIRFITLHPTPYTLHPIPYKPSVHGEAKARHALSGLLKICVNL